VTFTFHGSDTNDTFQCSLDGAPWAACTSPQQYTALAEGAHAFQVRAVNAAGEVDPTPASASFTVEATPPQTTITSAPSGRVAIGEVSISFTSTEPGSSFQCSLDSASYSPCSSPDVVKDPAAGPHTFKVEATNQAGVKETAPLPSASWSSVEPQHDLCGTISSNTTIGPDYAARYIITCSTTVASGATLTAQPGTIVKAEQGTPVSIEGTLDAVGTEAEPITFTSINDNSIGGATGSGSPAAGDWNGISSSADGSVDVERASVDYAGGGGYAGVGVTAGGAGGLTAVNDNFKTDGVLAYGPAAPVVEDDTFVSPSDEAVDVEASGTPTVEGNSVSSPDGIAFVVNGGAINPALLAGNTVSGGPSYFELSGEVATSGALPLLDIPWEVGQVNSAHESSGGGCLDVPAGVTLTSINDNSIGGATGSGSPAAGDWGRISATSSSQENPTVLLKGVHVLYATTGLADTTNKDVTVQSDVFAHNNTAVDISASYDVLTLSGTNAAIHETWFDENGVALEGSSDWEPIEPCFYSPTMRATGNWYGPTKASQPFVTPLEHAAIEAILRDEDNTTWPPRLARSRGGRRRRPRHMVAPPVRAAGTPGRGYAV
jgi:hypothetical protein